MTPRLRHALWLSLVLNAPLAAIGVHHRSYDAYTHMFFADHYARDWFSLWEPKWYSGFTVTSYPPLAHQVLALLSKPLGMHAAYAVAIVALCLLLPVALCGFARIFVRREAACWAALLSVFLPSLLLVNYVFGQFTTLFALVLALFAATQAYRYASRGDSAALALTVALGAIVASSHHFTFLVGFPVFLLAALTAALTRHPQRWRRAALRLLLVGAGIAAASLLLMWPFWDWLLTTPRQTPIDHVTRHNYLFDHRAAFVFLLCAYGLSLVALPTTLVALFRRRTAPLAAAAILFFVLGLGGTTALPRLLFGGWWEWLIYDRFAFFASLCLVIFLGSVLGKWSLSWEGRRPWLSGALGCGLAIWVLSGVLVLRLPQTLPTQPSPKQFDEILEFLHKDRHWEWRYITLGFGDQMVELSRLTVAPTVDGNCNSSRTLPELTSSGIDKLDAAKYWPNGVPTLTRFLSEPEPYSLKWVFCGDHFYEPLLRTAGWPQLYTFRDGTTVWERPGVAPLPHDEVARGDDHPWVVRVWWGCAPGLVLALVLGMVALGNWRRMGDALLR